MSSGSTITVIVPFFNTAHVVRTCLDSVLSQTAWAQEIIAVDDGSTDGGGDVVRTYGDKVVLLPRPENGGAGAARNSGLARATGDFVAFVDADDYWEPEFLARTSAFLRDHPACVAVSTAGCVRRSGRADRIVPARPWPLQSACVLEDFFSFWAAHDHVRTGTVLMRRAMVEEIGGQRADLRTSQDLEFWGCLATRGAWGFIPEVLWVGQSCAAARARGWRRKHRLRWQTCPTVDAWEARLRTLIEPADRAALDRVRGRVAAGYAQMMILGGNRAGARSTVRDYGREMPQNRLVRILRTADRWGRLPWLVVCALVAVRELCKGWRRES